MHEDPGRRRRPGQPGGLSLRHPAMREQRGRLAGEGPPRVAGPGEDGDRDLAEQPLPVFPVRQLNQIVRPHQPDQVDMREQPFHGRDGIDGVTGAENGLEGGDADARMIGRCSGLGDTLVEVCHAVLGLQRVLG